MPTYNINLNSKNDCQEALELILLKFPELQKVVEKFAHKTHGNIYELQHIRINIDKFHEIITGLKDTFTTHSVQHAWRLNHRADFDKNLGLFKKFQPKDIHQFSTTVGRTLAEKENQERFNIELVKKNGIPLKEPGKNLLGNNSFSQVWKKVSKKEK